MSISLHEKNPFTQDIVHSYLSSWSTVVAEPKSASVYLKVHILLFLLCFFINILTYIFQKKKII